MVLAEEVRDGVVEDRLRRRGAVFEAGLQPLEVDLVGLRVHPRLGHVEDDKLEEGFKVLRPGAAAQALL